MKHILKYFFLIYIFNLNTNMVFSQVVWSQNDWSNNQYDTLENVNPDISPGELILNNETSNMVYAFSPGPWEGVWDLEVYNEKLFIAACSRPLYINNGYVVSYDYSTNKLNVEYTVFEQGIIQIRKFNNKLYIPGADSRGSWLWGNIYIYDGSSWIRKETVPHGIHVFDLIFYNGDMYVSTGTDINNYSAKIYKSTDEGDSWTEVFSVQPNRRFYMMGIYNDTLYVQGDNNPPEGKVLFRYGGNNWTNIPFDSLVSTVGILEEFMGKFYFLNGRFLHIYNGVEWITINLPFSGAVNASQTWYRIARGLAFYNNKIYGGGENGILYSSIDGINWEIESELGNPENEIECIQVYHGRLYVGTNDTTDWGKVYVSSSIPQGSLTSLKHDFMHPIESGVINWSALIPDTNTCVKFQVRTAASEDSLDQVEFVGPDGTSQSFYETSGQDLSIVHSGDRWMQYKVFLQTSDSSLTPVLNEVNFIVSLIVSNDEKLKNKTKIFTLEQNYPNPFNPSTKIKYEIPKLSFVTLKVYDVLGNEITTIVNEEKPSGTYELTWVTDNLPGGVYFYRLQADSFVETKKMILMK